MPGREQEYDNYMRTGQSNPGATGPVNMPNIDSERRQKSPGMQHNFYDLSTSDFKKPYAGRRSSSSSNDYNSW